MATQPVAAANSHWKLFFICRWNISFIVVHILKECSFFMGATKSAIYTCMNVLFVWCMDVGNFPIRIYIYIYGLPLWMHDIINLKRSLRLRRTQINLKIKYDLKWSFVILMKNPAGNIHIHIYKVENRVRHLSWYFIIWAVADNKAQNKNNNFKAKLFC